MCIYTHSRHRQPTQGAWRSYFRTFRTEISKEASLFARMIYVCHVYIYIYIYIGRERERERCIYMCVYVHVYMCIYLYASRTFIFSRALRTFQTETPRDKRRAGRLPLLGGVRPSGIGSEETN